jgi:hypothetical protein
VVFVFRALFLSRRILASKRVNEGAPATPDDRRAHCQKRRLEMEWFSPVLTNSLPVLEMLFSSRCAKQLVHCLPEAQNIDESTETRKASKEIPL